jgi:hypothetical protein
MFVREPTFGKHDPRYGQIDAGTSTAIVAAGDAESISPLTYFFTAVAAGVTVFFITKWLGGRK